MHMVKVRRFKVRVRKKGLKQSVSPKRFGNTRVRRTRLKKNLAKRIAWAFGKFVILAAVFGIGYLGYFFFIKSDRFTVKEYVIQGNHFAQRHEIINVLEENSPMNIFFVKFLDLEEKLGAINWIEKVTINSEIPDTLILHVTERKPVALGIFEKEVHLLDRRGVLIDTMIPDYSDFQLPVLNGLGDPVSEDYAVRLQQGLEVARLLDDPDINLREEISEIDISIGHNVRLLKGYENTEILLGKGDFREKLIRYKNLKHHIDSKFSRLNYIDLRFNRRVIIHPSPESG